MTRAAKPSRLEQPLLELMRCHKRKLDGVADGILTLGMPDICEMAKSVGTMQELLEEQERQERPSLTTADWLGRAELQINELRRLAARGGLDGVTLQRSIDAAMTQLVAARAAAGRRP
ncbi:hypothetical protein FP2506_11552 [Fulvimarina pelagi HTCC2506]|uniref:Uncharacterized protein n=2 Tax=Fulvimarina pelagi TaxID=217511 RepID=Q0FYW9_9HYPH|nr:hypothetical protein FP2506_11552 [Fulvimarina pelagi HTCC2506]